MLAFASAVRTSLTDWHSRLGHPAISILNKIDSCFRLPVSSNALLASPCNACSTNKMHKLPFTASSLKSTCPLDFVFSDVWTSPLISIDGFKYYVIFVDHFTRYTWIYPLKQKSHAFDVFTTFKSLVENRFQTRIRTLYTDNGGEYIGLRNFLSSHGISHMTSPPHTPEHNGIAERRHRHIAETGLALLSHASMPKSYWTYAFGTTVYLINRMPTPTLDFQNPFQCFYNETPNYEKLRVFGCLCFPWLRPYASHKLDSRSTPCVFLGYSPSQSVYFCLDRTTSKIYTSRHVLFHETVFPFAISSPLHVQEQAEPDEEHASSSPSVTLIPSPQETPTPAPPQAPSSQPLVRYTSVTSSPIPPPTTTIPASTSTCDKSGQSSSPSQQDQAQPMVPPDPAAPTNLFRS